MIKKSDVVKAMKMLRGEIYPDPTGLYRQLFMSLQVYRDRNELDGTVRTAMECLELAGYEIEEL